MTAVVHPQVQEALEELLLCVQKGFTGSLTFDFDHGIPMVIKVMAVKRFQKQRK